MYAIRGEAAGSLTADPILPRTPPGADAMDARSAGRPGGSDTLRAPDPGYPLASTHRASIGQLWRRAALPTPRHQEGDVIDRRRMDVTTPATPQDARELRVRFEHWLRENDAPVTVAEDLGLAVYEALANATEHAYVPEHPAPTMRLLAWLDRDDVMIWVIDHGRWLHQGESRYRSRGLALMRHLTTDVHVEPSAQGTTVHLRAHLSVKEGSARSD